MFELPPSPPAAGRRFIEGSLEVACPIEFEQQQIGTMYLRADLSRMYGQIALHAIIIGTILLVIIVATIAPVATAARPIAEPILALARLARRVAQQKDYSARRKAEQRRGRVAHRRI